MLPRPTDAAPASLTALAQSPWQSHFMPEGRHCPGFGQRAPELALARGARAHHADAWLLALVGLQLCREPAHGTPMSCKPDCPCPPRRAQPLGPTELFGCCWAVCDQQIAMRRRRAQLCHHQAISVEDIACDSVGTSDGGDRLLAQESRRPWASRPIPPMLCLVPAGRTGTQAKKRPLPRTEPVTERSPTVSGTFGVYVAALGDLQARWPAHQCRNVVCWNRC